DLDVGPGVLAEEDLVAGLDVELELGPVVQDLPVADRDDLALLGLLLRGVGDDDPALDGLLLFDPADDQAVVKRTNLHVSRLSFKNVDGFPGARASGIRFVSRVLRGSLTFLTVIGRNKPMHSITMDAGSSTQPRRVPSIGCRLALCQGDC